MTLKSSYKEFLLAKSMFEKLRPSFGQEFVGAIKSLKRLKKKKTESEKEIKRQKLEKEVVC